MNATVMLTGYDKATEELSTLTTMPEPLLSYARNLAGVPDTDPVILAVYPLTPVQASAIASRAKIDVETERFDYCLEAIADDPESRVKTV